MTHEQEIRMERIVATYEALGSLTRLHRSDFEEHRLAWGRLVVEALNLASEVGGNQQRFEQVEHLTRTRKGWLTTLFP